MYQHPTSVMPYLTIMAFQWHCIIFDVS